MNIRAGRMLKNCGPVSPLIPSSHVISLKKILTGVNPDHLTYFHFVGRILGIAVFHGHCLDGGFTTPFYKQLLNKPITLSDIEGVDPELHRSLTWMLWVT